jgi:Ser/Thr protein kinase RdoA (MazF antagonist)
LSWEQKANLPTGAIHADIHPGNILRGVDDRLWLLDFDDAHVSARALDWMLAALEFSFSGDRLDQATFHKYLAALRPPTATQEERDAEPQLLKLLLLKFAVTESALGTPLSGNRYLRLFLD